MSLRELKCETLIEEHISFLKEREVCSRSGDRLVISSAFTYASGDSVDVFVRPQFDGSLMVSDMGNTLAQMRAVGFDPLQSERARFLLSRVLIQNRVSLDDAAGQVIYSHIPSVDGLGRAINDVVSACLSAGDLLYLSRASSPAVITDEVAAVLRDINVRFTENKSVIGEVTHKRFRVDFSLDNDRGETGYIKTIGPSTSGGRTQAANAAFRMWFELGSATLRVTVIDDRYSEWPSADVAILRQRSTVLSWATQATEFRRTVEAFAGESAHALGR